MRYTTAKWTVRYAADKPAAGQGAVRLKRVACSHGVYLRSGQSGSRRTLHFAPDDVHRHA